ncbi:hypothetical protein GJ633_04590 [Halorubrum sp. CBA1125]|uniref:GIDE domain-containing protein n=1 Tax=Halorubrum sp. CBA1125 TaxID=2668072 RepID=UPI0012E7BDC2|nr:GIDE domain-containing protein [Halorubrum sp. CBA1125]MUW14018.1 hypothetical protein [Halorubrum sp. CBA1125]
MVPLHPLHPGVALLRALASTGSSNLLPVAIGALALLVGLAFLAYGAKGSLDAFRVARATATDPTGLIDDDRRVRVAGRAEAVDGETLSAPFAGDPCLCCVYDISEYRSQGKGRSWVTIDSGEAGVPFRIVDGGTGVRVDPAAATFVFGVDAELTVDADEPPPERVRRFVDAVDDVDEAEAGRAIGPITVGADPERRYRQRVLRPGDPVTVVGDAAAFPDAPAGEVKVRLDGGSPFVVADADARRTALRLVGRSAVPLVMGAVALAVGLLGLSPLLGGGVW